MNQEKVGQLIKKLRQDNKLTQAELAEKLGVTYQAVSKWENGKNVPDIATLKEISKLFNIDIDDIINGEKKEKIKNNNKYLITGIGIIALLFIFILILSIHIINNNHEDKIEINDISATCEKFNVTGSLVHSNDKSYIRISNIEFCADDDVVYKEIECTLYEKNGNIINKITSCNKGYNVKLKDHLSMVKLSRDDYTSICSIKNKELYIEINATLDNGKTTTYKIPLEVSDTCNK